jgi:hypothetical protein
MVPNDRSAQCDDLDGEDLDGEDLGGEDLGGEDLAVKGDRLGIKPKASSNSLKR